MTLVSKCLRNTLLLALAMMLVATSAHAEPPLGHWGLQKHRTSRVKRARNTYGSHYFLSSTAIPLKKHDGFYKNTLVSLNSVVYGLTNNLSVGASLDLVTLIRSREGGPIYSGRLQFSGPVGEIIHIGASVQYLNVRVPVGAEVPEGTEVPPGFAVAMGMVTIGSMNNQITLAGGWTHDGENAGDGPVLNIGGALRLFANVMLVTEHWIFTDPSEPFLTHSLGCRILGDDLAIDIGLAYDDEVTTKVTPVGMPFLSATLNF
ncbi:MAG: hypothetical protein KDC00_05925 [Flavobacteriales bacterium]|nr:hypothetical protein [Flavobacteriales bacterium]